MTTSEQWERAFEREIGKRSRPSILGGRDYFLNAVIQYRPFGLPANTTGERHVRVTSIESDVKNQCPGFTGRMVDQHTDALSVDVWGYDNQITRVISTGDRCENREVSDGAW